MKRGWRSLFAVLTVVGLGLTLAAAQKGPPKPKVKYDPATEITLKGTIENLTEYECPVSGGVGAHIELKTEEGTAQLHIALAKFLKEYEIKFEKGETIEVIGSKVKLNDADAILVRQITRGQNTYMFREKDGKPIW